MMQSTFLKTQGTPLRTRPLYDTWDIFKRDVEINLGYYLPNNLWLQSKPRKALPWSKFDLEETMVRVKKIREVFLDSI
jgi:hypothetical protein